MMCENTHAVSTVLKAYRASLGQPVDLHAEAAELFSKQRRSAKARAARPRGARRPRAFFSFSFK